MPPKRIFVDKEHQLTWMYAGGARELNALLPAEVRARGGHTAGAQAHRSGRLRRAGAKGGKRSQQIARDFRKCHS
ncbi:MAG: hypothetical protein AUI36_45865 [Cyanobacteria bacterium 13_1_40CM_2_61_4]|nr:MAG: hypothetical protein AUI36_45865 [Cyanobacteria bacterium 13_1_40CM_2_61_4]